MAKTEKKRAKINGVSVKDGDQVTVVFQATVKVYEGQKYDGGQYVYVTLEGKGTEDLEGPYLETEYAEKGRKTKFPGVTVLPVKS